MQTCNYEHKLKIPIAMKKNQNNFQKVDSNLACNINPLVPSVLNIGRLIKILI